MPDIRTGFMRAPGSAHRRDDEGVRSVAAAVGPACGDRLDLGPEFDAFHAVLVGVAEGRAFPAAERMIGDRHRDRDVDADHADVYEIGRASCRASGCQEVWFSVVGETLKK